MVQAQMGWIRLFAWANRKMVFLNCPNPVNSSSFYVDASPCINGDYRSNSSFSCSRRPVLLCCFWIHGCIGGGGLVQGRGDDNDIFITCKKGQEYFLHGDLHQASLRVWAFLLSTSIICMSFFLIFLYYFILLMPRVLKSLRLSNKHLPYNQLDIISGLSLIRLTKQACC